MRAILFSLTLLAAAPAFAQSEQNASDASKATSTAAGAIGESGLRAASGVVAVPLAVVGAGSVATGAVASAAGSPRTGAASAGAGSAMVGGAGDASAFANKPLKVTRTVVVAPPAQAAPNVPFEAQQPGAKANPR